jgi:hypothetical protein
MRTNALVLSAVVILATACTSERSDHSGRPSPPANTRTPDEEMVARVQIYAAVIRRLVTRDHTFGRGTSPFKYVYVVNGAFGDAGDPLSGDLFGPAPMPFSSVISEGIEEQLQDLPPIRFVIDGNRLRRGNEGMGGVKNDGVIISLGTIERKKNRVHVSNGLWCGGLCGQWLTYVLRRSEGRWKITGTTGPYAIS